MYMQRRIYTIYLQIQITCESEHLCIFQKNNYYFILIFDLNAAGSNKASH